MPIDAATGSQPLKRIALNGPTMGTRYAALFHAAEAPSGLADALALEVSEVDQQMSTWKPESDLMRFNGAKVGEWVALPDRLLEVVETGLEIGQISGGAFDIGVLDLMRAWGFAVPDGTPDKDEVARLAATKRQPAHERIELDRAQGRMRKRVAISIDLSGIAKGYGVDRLAAVMREYGIADFIVSIDGEVVAQGHKPDGEPWRVGLEEPDSGRRAVAGVIDLEDAALATSGDYRHRVTLAGRTYAHSMDPRTGWPVTNDIQSVTVRAPTCMEADAWATVVMVLRDEALPLLKARGMDVLIVRRT